MPVPKRAADRSFMAAACIGCGACVAACPNASGMLFLGAKITHLGELPQGQPERDARVVDMLAQHDHEGFGGCTNIGECSSACPKEIPLEPTNKDLHRDQARSQSDVPPHERCGGGLARRDTLKDLLKHYRPPLARDLVGGPVVTDRSFGFFSRWRTCPTWLAVEGHRSPDSSGNCRHGSTHLEGCAWLPSGMNRWPQSEVREAGPSYSQRSARAPRSIPDTRAWQCRRSFGDLFERGGRLYVAYLSTSALHRYPVLPVGGSVPRATGSQPGNAPVQTARSGKVVTYRSTSVIARPANRRGSRLWEGPNVRRGTEHCKEGHARAIALEVSNYFPMTLHASARRRRSTEPTDDRSRVSCLLADAMKAASALNPSSSWRQPPRVLQGKTPLSAGGGSGERRRARRSAHRLRSHP